jgi:hypothetical protein
MKWIIKALACTIIGCIANHIYSQQYYFNEIYNPNKTWAIGLSIIGIDTGYFGCAISSDSITTNYNTCTFVMSETGKILHWNNFGRWGAHFYAGDEGALAQNNNHFGLFTTVEDGVLETDYGIFFKFDQYGDTILTRTFFDETDTLLKGRTCTATQDGGYALLGNNFPVDLADLLLIKTDSNGNEQWRQQYGTDSSDWAKCVIQTADKGFALGTWTRQNAGVYQRVTADPLVFKTDSLGNLEWTLNLGGPVMDDKAMLCPTLDSCIMVLTTIGDSMFSIEYAYAKINLSKIDLQGNIIWNKKYGASTVKNSISNLSILENGDIICCGSVKYSIYLNPAGWLFRFNSNGDSLWYREYWYYPEDPGNYGHNYLNDVSTTSDNGFIAVGYAYASSPSDYHEKMWTLKIDSVGCEIADCWVGLEEQGSAEAGGRGGLEIWPNPASQVISVKSSVISSGKDCSIVIYDVFGREITEIKVPDRSDQVQINVESYPAGVYIAILKNGSDLLGSGKFVVARP